MYDDADQNAEGERRSISLYEFYVLGIDRLLMKAPWELGRAVSTYHQMFLNEQRCIGLTILLLIGEEYVPDVGLNALPGYEDQARASANRAVFLRALKHYFERTRKDASRAEKVLKRMGPYVVEARAATEAKTDPVKRMLETLCKRVPPKDERQRQLYEDRLEKMYSYIEALVQNDLLEKYPITKQ